MSFAVPNTLRLESQAPAGCFARSAAEVVAAQNAARAAGLTIRYTGAGSNLLPMPRVDAFVCVVAIAGIQVVAAADDEVLIEAGAGEDWHGLVMHTLEQGYYGLENLALIPGSTGAAPVQNIGAYGAELADFVHEVRVVDSDGSERVLGSEACGFGYRTSVFQTRPDWAIVAVTLRLRKTPAINLSYAELARRVAQNATPQEVASAVCAIRREKLPDPAIDPNAGSFFKNPVVTQAQAAILETQIPDLTTHSTPTGIKLSAAQLIDRAGWKQKSAGPVLCWHRQPLVLVNHGARSATEVVAFADAIRADVATRYGVSLELEPCVLD